MQDSEEWDKKYRVDLAGNVIARHATPKSVLAWEVDHFYPHSKGGFSVLENLHLIQANVNKTLKKRQVLARGSKFCSDWNF